MGRICGAIRCRPRPGLLEILSVHPAADDIAPFVPTHAVTHDVAAANQQGQPTSYGEQLAALNHNMGYAQAYADKLETDPGA